MQHRSLILVGLFLVGILLVSCTRGGQGMSFEKENPLTAEYIADEMLQYVTALQIRAKEKNEEIKDPAMLRAIDDVTIASRALQKVAHTMQDEGKSGSLFGVNNNFAAGSVILSGEWLYTDYDFEVSAAPGVEVYLAKHVSPKTEEELFSEAVQSIGALQSFRGAQRYAVGALSDADWNEYRTVALYSHPMSMVIGLAQIRGKVR